MFVIYLSNMIPGYNNRNDYGYWTGKTFRHENVIYPGVEYEKDDADVKVYKSKKRAESMAVKLIVRYTFVTSAVVEEL